MKGSRLPDMQGPTTEIPGLMCFRRDLLKGGLDPGQSSPHCYSRVEGPEFIGLRPNSVLMRSHLILPVSDLLMV
jgi:hypothetical protein